jgi:hypothetical protein
MITVVSDMNLSAYRESIDNKRIVKQNVNRARIARTEPFGRYNG